MTRFAYFQGEIVPIEQAQVSIMTHTLHYGTGVQIAPITRIDHRTVGSGAIGPVIKRLSDLYFRTVRGEEPAYAHWLSPVPQLQGTAA